MPQLRYTSEVSALSGRSNSPLQSANSDPDAFGAAAGRAMQQLGQSIDRGVQVAYAVDQQEKEKARKQNVANKVATFDWTRQENELKDEVGEDAEEYQLRVREGYSNYVTEYTKDIQDDQEREAVRNALLSDLPAISSRAADYQYTARTNARKNQSNEALNVVKNKIMADPSSFDKFREEGAAVIDSAEGINATLREGMKREWRFDSAKNRFEGLINNARSLEELDTIANELTGKGDREWFNELRDTDYSSLINLVGTTRKQFNAQFTSNAKAALSVVEERTKKEPYTVLPSTELRNVQEAVAKTSDVEATRRMARTLRNQEITRREGRLPLAELKARKNATDGNPGVAYPDLPIEVSNAVNKAAEQFGVSASFLGATAMREYGSYLKAGKRQKTEEELSFMPMSMGGVDLRNMRNDVVDALTFAGQQFGGQLTLTSGRKVIGNNSVLVSTAGMSEPDKAKMIASMVDAGFSGFADNGDTLEAAMLTKVPAGFSEKDAGKVWGGWTEFSPEVSAVLKERGFKGGAEASSLIRKNVPKTQGVDYTQGTGIKDESGKPTSSAVGLFQFTKGTWLNTVKDPDVAAAMGIDPAMPDDKLLELRKDPEKSTLAAAALARKNQASMEKALGRPVTDAELYMGHFMGSGGAVAFITSVENKPNALAADVLPEAAAANKPVFFDKKGGKYTTEQVYNNIALSFKTQPSQIAFEDNEHRKAMIDAGEKIISSYPMQLAINTGSHSVEALDVENGFAKRGQVAKAYADYQSIPVSDMKPFTEDEELTIKKIISEGTVDKNLELFASIQSMGDDMAKAAMKQVGEKDGVFAHAAGLYMNGGTVIAGDIIRGRKRLVDNPAIVEQIGATKQEISGAFAKATDVALFDIKPEDRQSIEEAATALYVERMASLGGSAAKFDRGAYEKAVNEVLSGRSGVAAIDYINGTKTVVPSGMSASEVEGAIKRMTLEDWTALSDTGEPPRYADGSVVDVADIRDEVSLMMVGPNEYRAVLDDGTVLRTSGSNNAGRARAFILKIDPAKMKRISSRPSPSESFVIGKYPSFTGGL